MNEKKKSRPENEEEVTDAHRKKETTMNIAQCTRLMPYSDGWMQLRLFLPGFWLQLARGDAKLSSRCAVLYMVINSQCSMLNDNIYPRIMLTSG